MTSNWNRLTFVLLLLTTMIGGTAADAKPVFESRPITQVHAGKDYVRLTFQILSISCPACVYGMEREMSKLPGVKYAKIELLEPNGALCEIIYDHSVTGQTPVIDVVHEFRYSEAEVKEAPFVADKPTAIQPDAKAKKKAKRL